MQSLDSLEWSLAHSSGRYYVIGWIDPSETVDGLGLARANAVVRALISRGFCREKLVPLDGGVAQAAPPARSNPEPRVRLTIITPQTDELLRAQGVLR